MSSILYKAHNILLEKNVSKTPFQSKINLRIVNLKYCIIFITDT